MGRMAMRCTTHAPVTQEEAVLVHLCGTHGWRLQAVRGASWWLVQRTRREKEGEEHGIETVPAFSSEGHSPRHMCQTSHSTPSLHAPPHQSVHFCCCTERELRDNMCVFRSSALFLTR